jgi:L-alanine-DL-glutamate epimerase-like enolase superfamily enzyme
MKITQISYERLELQLSEPYTIAYETISRATNFILKIETDTDLVGYGCAAPDPIVTEEVPNEVEEAIRNTIVPFLSKKNPFYYARIIEELSLILKGKSSALAMVDMALLDLVAKKCDVPLYQFLGGYRDRIATSITIGILSVDETLRVAKQYVDMGFFILKVKGGLNFEEDIEKMLRLKEVFPKVILRFDGNQGYTVADSVAFVKATKRARIEIFEQPTKVGSDHNMGLVTQGTDIPVMADESLKTLKDVFRLARNERIDMINIKLQKVGGILEGMHINSVAKSAKLEAMVGCIDECSLGIAAGLHFALSRPNMQYADLDGHLDMVDDPFRGIFKIEKGIMYPSEFSGLGDLDYN